MITKQRKEEINRTFSENALRILKKRYLLVDDKGNQESPADMFLRVAKYLAAVEKDYGKDPKLIKQIEEDFFEIMARKEYTPAGRTMTNAGAGTMLVANCIVLPIDDSLESIFQTLKDAALLQQAGAGLGFALDRMRPAMTKTITSRGTSSGPVAFLKIYNEAFGIIKQQGRHGANMAMMSVDHPDILELIRAKEVEGKIRNFNISVKVTDEFMKKLVESPDDEWYCSWKEEWPALPGGLTKVKPRRVLTHPNGVVYDSEEVDITVRELFDEIVNYAWLNGEPGIVFIDTVNKTNPLPDFGPIESSNPCGEQFLHPYDNCNLGSINLAALTRKGKVDYARLSEVTKTAIRLMDNVIDRFDFPVPQVTELAKKNRRIGLGVMGFADLLYQLGVRYNSPEGVELAEKVMSVIQEAAHEMSRELAKEKGVFPHYKSSIYAKEKVRMRNAALTTVAPTGTISMMFDASSGMEPNFALAYVKQDKDSDRYAYLNQHFEAELKRRGFNEKEMNEIKEEVLKTGTIQLLTYLPQDLRDTFVVSMDMSGDDHIRMQAAFQAHVDNSISKTINFPNLATREEIKKSYILAWQLGCKSATVYREGSRLIEAISLGKGETMVAMTEDPTRQVKVKAIEGEALEGNGLIPRTRPETLIGRTYKIKTGYGNLYITVNEDENGKLFEIFATIGKSGGFFQEQSEAICRMISLALRSGIKVEVVIEQLKGIRGPMPVMTEKGTILSLPDAIARIMEEHLSAKEAGGIKEEIPVMSGETISQKLPLPKDIADYGLMPGCPDCGASLILAEGCMSCPSCGYSRCL